MHAICLVLVACLLTSARSLPSENNISPLMNLYHLGMVEGKSFFVEYPTVDRDWTSANNLCAASNLRLASVTSTEQEIVLGEALRALPSANLKYVSWTSGRDARQLFQFSWGTNPNASVSSDLVFEWHGPELVTCLAFHHHKSYSLRYQSYPCSNKMGTICESKLKYSAE